MRVHVTLTSNVAIMLHEHDADTDNWAMCKYAKIHHEAATTMATQRKRVEWRKCAHCARPPIDICSRVSRRYMQNEDTHSHTIPECSDHCRLPSAYIYTLVVWWTLLSHVKSAPWTDRSIPHKLSLLSSIGARIQIHSGSHVCAVRAHTAHIRRQQEPTWSVCRICYIGAGKLRVTVQAYIRQLRVPHHSPLLCLRITRPYSPPFHEYYYYYYFRFIFYGLSRAN